MSPKGANAVTRMDLVMASTTVGDGCRKAIRKQETVLLRRSQIFSHSTLGTSKAQNIIQAASKQPSSFFPAHSYREQVEKGGNMCKLRLRVHPCGHGSTKYVYCPSSVPASSVDEETKTCKDTTLEKSESVSWSCVNSLCVWLPNLGPWTCCQCGNSGINTGFCDEGTAGKGCQHLFCRSCELESMNPNAPILAPARLTSRKTLSAGERLLKSGSSRRLQVLFNPPRGLPPALRGLTATKCSWLGRYESGIQYDWSWDRSIEDLGEPRIAWRSSRHYCRCAQ